AIATGDIDNDGFMDFVIMGLNLSTTIPSPVTRVYTYGKTSDNLYGMIHNMTWEANITPVGGGALALADFDNDGRLDLIISGQNDTILLPNRKIFVYTNNGTKFVANSTWGANLTPIYNGSIAVGDINNDGWPDAVVSGTAEFFFTVAPLTRHFSWTGVYLNNHTYLNYSAAFSRELMGLNYSSIVLADFDNDTRLDLLIAGKKALTNQTGIYTNNGTNFNYNVTFSVNLTNSSTSTLHAADINNDGLMDLIQLIAGRQPQTARVYINNKTALMENATWQANITPLINGNAAFGDINNDGWLDLVAQGFNNATTPAADVQVYLNNNTNFQNNVPFESEITPANHGDIVLADFTNDSDLDLLVTGQTTPAGGKNVTQIYTNDIHLNNTNTQPSPPTAFSTASNGLNSINFTWNAGSDTETPTGGLYYNLRIGTCTGCQNITSGAYGGGGPSAGGLFGNMQKRQRVSLAIPNDTTYYWSVQTIDTGFARSAWSTEQTYNPTGQGPGPGTDTTPPTWDTQAQSANSLSQFGELYLSAQAQDETNLTWAYLVTNETGTWINWTGKYGSPQQLGGNTTKQLVNFTWTNFSLEGGQNIGWYIMLNDSSNNTNVTFIQNFSLLKTISISINPYDVSFAPLQPGGFNSTGTDAGYNPLPFVINNTGNFATNITIESTSIFTSILNPNIYFQFKSEVNETGSVRDAVRELIASFLNIPLAGSPVMIANMTNFTDGNDEIRAHINVTIPAQEPPSNLTSTVTFTAAAAY
ncbi:MAG: VCBS repeat-containing protein, partial [DPANN group archaeon]|nr:VCBS repeat-containing protein [DPANN group archaeon]